MLSNIRTNSSGPISTPLVAGLVLSQDQKCELVANTERMLKNFPFGKFSVRHWQDHYGVRARLLCIFRTPWSWGERAPGRRPLQPCSTTLTTARVTLRAGG